MYICNVSFLKRWGQMDLGPAGQIGFGKRGDIPCCNQQERREHGFPLSPDAAPRRMEPWRGCSGKDEREAS